MRNTYGKQQQQQQQTKVRNEKTLHLRNTARKVKKLRKNAYIVPVGPVMKENGRGSQKKQKQSPPMTDTKKRKQSKNDKSGKG